MNLFFFYFICTLLSYSYLTHSMNTYVCMLRCWKADFFYSRGYVEHLLPTVPAEILNQMQHNSGLSLNNHVFLSLYQKAAMRWKSAFGVRNGLAGTGRSKMKRDREAKKTMWCSKPCVRWYNYFWKQPSFYLGIERYMTHICPIFLFSYA